jgi:hypothetical protein
MCNIDKCTFASLPPLFPAFASQQFQYTIEICEVQIKITTEPFHRRIPLINMMGKDSKTCTYFVILKRDYLPGASGQKISILFSGAPNLIVTLSPSSALIARYEKKKDSIRHETTCQTNHYDDQD